MEINQKYIDLLYDVMKDGILVNCRGYETREIISQITVTNMNQPLVTLSKRKLGYRFACAEAAWILSGDNKVATIQPFSKIIKDFSDDGIFFFGAYGPKILDQLEYIGRCFKKDIHSRQAVINIWREKPPVSKDIPCTLNIQFLIRAKEDRLYLNTVVNIRSSDIWLGVPYDWFTFSMVSAYVVLYLRNILPNNDIYLGELLFHAGSRHYYQDAFGYNEDYILDVIEENPIIDFNYNPINLNEFKNEDELVFHLYSLAQNKKCFKDISFLKELETWWSKR